MSQTFFVKALLVPTIPTVLYTVPPDAAYAYCDLKMAAANGAGITFVIGASKSGIIAPQDTLFNVTQPLTSEDGSLENNFSAKEILLGQGESLIALTQQTDVTVRLSGYAYAAAPNAVLNIN